MLEASFQSPRRRKRLFDQAETGITPKHSRACPAKGWDEPGVCTCKPRFAPWVYGEGKKILYGGTYPTLAAAKSWRTNAESDKDRGKLRETTKISFAEAADALIAGMRDGSIRNRKREPWKPKVVRDYTSALERLKLDFGPYELAKTRRKDWQRWADERLSEGLSGSRVKNLLMPAHVIYRRAVRDDEVPANPLSDLDLPASNGTRERVADPQEAAKQLEALPEHDRALWATAFYAGPRMGELRGLRVEDIDLDASVIRIERSWDDVEGEIPPKSTAGKRTIPVCDHLRGYLEPHLERLGRHTGLVFGETATAPFNYGKTTRRAYAAWKEAKLKRITLHNCRHSFRSFLDYAGISEARCDRYLGHANHSVGRRYTHSFESELAGDAKLLDSYLEGATAGKIIALREAS